MNTKEELQKLYDVMAEKYEAWANVTRPEPGKMAPMSLMAHEEYLERLGNFRSRQWAEYTKSRDEYEKVRDQDG